MITSHPTSQSTPLAIFLVFSSPWLRPFESYTSVQHHGNRASGNDSSALLPVPDWSAFTITLQRLHSFLPSFLRRLHGADKIPELQQTLRTKSVTSFVFRVFICTRRKKIPRCRPPILSRNETRRIAAAPFHFGNCRGTADFRFGSHMVAAQVLHRQGCRRRSR